MKKLLFISSLVVMLSTVMPVFATETTLDQNTQEAEVTVTYGVADGYQIVIPDSFDFTADSEGNITEASSSVVASKVYIPYGTELNVTIGSSNYANSKWNLVDQGENLQDHADDNTDNVCVYTIGKTTGASDVANGDAVLTVPAGTVAGGSQELFFNIPTAPTIAGTYMDTLNFEVSVDPQTQQGA